MNPYHRISDFHGARLKGVGSSDIATLAGYNKRYSQLYRWTDSGVEERLPQTTRTLWLEKTGRVVQVEDPKKDPKGWLRKKMGNRLEPIVASEYIEAHYGPEAAHDFYRNATRAEPVSTPPFRVKTEAFHPARRYCLAHADILIDGGIATPSGSKPWPLLPREEDGIVPSSQPHLVEVKTSGFMAGKRRDANPGDGYDPDDLSQFGIPDKVFMQVQWQLFCYGIESATVAVLIDTADYREYGPVVFDPRHVEKSLALAEAFWSLVESDTEPSPETWDDVVSVFPRIENTTAMISGEAEIEARAMVARGDKIKANMKEEKEQLEDINAGLGILAGQEVEVDEDGKKKLKRIANAVLVASDGQPIAKFYEKTRDSLSLPMAEIEKKQKKAAANAKKLAEGKTLKAEDIQAAELTTEEKEILAIEARLRALGCYKTSEPWREVRY